MQWARDPSSGLCRLWPPPSVDNPVTHGTEPVYQAVPQLDSATTTTTAAATAAAAAAPPSLPDGFALSDDPSVAYLQIVRRVKLDRNTLISKCHEHHADAFPAVPRTQQQFGYLKTHLLHADLGVGLSDDEVEGVFRDISTGSEVVLPLSWWYNGQVRVSTSYNCMSLVPDGLFSSRCTSLGRWLHLSV